MQFDDDAFRAMTPGERLTMFNALPSVEKAELVRTQARRWLETHRGELSPAQIEVIEAGIALVRPEMYERERDSRLLIEAKQFEWRAAEVLSREQMREAFTVHW